MKLLFFSDMHCHNYEDYSIRLENGRNSRLQDCLNIVEQVRQWAIANPFSRVYFLGDVFHARYRLDVDVLTATREAFNQLARECGLYMLVGNHDQYTRVGEVHATSIFADGDPYVDLEVLDKPGQWLSGTFTVAWYPHTSDVPAMKEWIKQLPPTDIFIFHQGVSEAAVGPYDMHIKTEISINDLPLDKVRFCIAGDYHKRQFIKNFHYVGSPLQLSQGERGEDKCFTVIDTETWTLSSIPTNAPKFYKFDNLKEFHEEQKIDLNKDFVELHVPTSEYKAGELLKAKYPRIKLIGTEEKAEARARVGSEVIGNDRKLCEQYIANNPTELDNTQVLAEALSLLQEDSE